MTKLRQEGSSAPECLNKSFLQCLLIKDLPSQGKDYLSIGSPECDNIVCARDEDFKDAAGTTPDSAAAGYCTEPCTSTCAEGYSCRSLLLDQQTLEALFNSPDGGTDEQARFGNIRSTNFCVKNSQ